jgi:hypothetical protein
MPCVVVYQLYRGVITNMFDFNLTFNVQNNDRHDIAEMLMEVALNKIIIIIIIIIIKTIYISQVHNTLFWKLRDISVDAGIVSSIKPPVQQAYDIQLEQDLRDELLSGYEAQQRPNRTVNVAVSLTLLTINDLVRT